MGWPVKFSWQVPLPGEGRLYVSEIVSTVPLAGDRTVIAAEVGTAWTTTYPYRDESGLFRIFADTGLSPAAFHNFACKYGFLGKVSYRSPYPLGMLSTLIGIPWAKEGRVERADVIQPRIQNFPDRHSNDGYWKVESVNLWRVAVQAMRHWVELWELTRRRQLQELGKIIAFDGNLFSIALPPFEGRDHKLTLPMHWVDDHDSTRFVPGDIIAVAWAYLQRQIAYALEQTAPVKCIAVNPHLPPKLVCQPVSLWAAMCLQFAEAMAKEKDYRQCIVCQKWFELSPGINRANKVACSSACRVKAFRRKHARENASSLGEIGAEILTTIDRAQGTLPDSAKGSGPTKEEAKTAPTFQMLIYSEWALYGTSKEYLAAKHDISVADVENYIRAEEQEFQRRGLPIHRPSSPPNTEPQQQGKRRVGSEKRPRQRRSKD